MADLYVDDDSTPSSPYSSWATAAPDLETALNDAAATAGSRIFIAHDSIATYSASLTYNSAGTLASPILVISADKTTGEPPSTYTAGAIEDADGGAYTIDSNGFLIAYGVTFKSGYLFRVAINNYFKIINGQLELNQNSVGGKLALNNSGSILHLEKTNVVFVNTGAFIQLKYASQFVWDGGALTGDLDKLIGAHNVSGAFIRVRGVDLSSMVGGNLVDGFGGTTDEPAYILFEGCKLNATPPSLVLDTPGNNDVGVCKMIGCYSDSTPYFQEHFTEGDVYSDSSVYRAGEDPAANNFSAKMVCNANATYHRPLRYKLADRWCSANPTITVECVHDAQGDGTGSALQDDEFWIEVQYPTSALAAYRQWDRQAKMATVLSTPADQPTSTVSWTGTGGFGSVVKQKVSTTISGGAAGVHTVWACLGTGAANTVYVCPQVDVS